MPDTPAVLFHEPGTRTRAGVLDIGQRCNHSCLFCYYSYLNGAGSQFGSLRQAAMRPTQACLDQLARMADHGLARFDITGGEPTLHPDLVDIVRQAEGALGLSARLITLGQYLTRPRRQETDTLLDALLAAGLTDCLFSIHAVDEDHFRRFTGGSWSRLEKALDRLEAIGFQYAVNTVVFSENYTLLPEIARTCAARGVYAHNFILFNPRHHWDGADDTARLLPDPAAVAPYLREAVAILDAADVAVTVRYAPLCAFPGLERHIVGLVGVHYDPHEWANRAGNLDRSPEYCAAPTPVSPEGLLADAVLTRQETVLDGVGPVVGWRGKAFKVFPAACAGCTAMAACDGLSPVALRRHGSWGVTPFQGPVAQGLLLRARLAYRPPFFLKQQPLADMRAAIRADRAARPC